MLYADAVQTHARLDCPDPAKGPVDVVLDTDTYNEIDDQFALAYALLSPERIKLHAVYAAPFHNDRSDGPGHGMALSHGEILRVLDRMGVPDDGLVYRGAEAWLPLGEGMPPGSPACDDLIERARAATEGRPLYVLAIGAPTNVAAALLRAPDIADRVVVVWLGGQPLHWPTADEFNLRQDLRASRAILSGRAPLMLVPCEQVAQSLRTTTAELDAYLAGRSPIGTYLAEIFAAYRGSYLQKPGLSKEIWDLAPLAWLLNPAWAPSTIEASPVLTDQLTWSVDHGGTSSAWCDRSIETRSSPTFSPRPRRKAQQRERCRERIAEGVHPGRCEC